MNKIIQNELKKCSIAIPDWDSNTTQLFIKRNNGNNNSNIQAEEIVDLDRDVYYIIKLEGYIIHPFDGFDLDSKWNNGVVPKSSYLMGTPVKFVGKMVQWDACGYDYTNKQSLEDVYSGLWLPSKGFTVVEKL